jgi:hypothetical protein
MAEQLALEHYHGRRVSSLVTPWGNVIEITDECDENFRHVMFREVFSAYLNDEEDE